MILVFTYSLQICLNKNAIKYIYLKKAKPNCRVLPLAEIANVAIIAIIATVFNSVTQ